MQYAINLTVTTGYITLDYQSGKNIQYCDKERYNQAWHWVISIAETQVTNIQLWSYICDIVSHKHRLPEWVSD